MAQTNTQTNGGVQNNHVAVGRFLDTGTVAATKFTCGFKPRYVKVMNITSGDQLEWFEGEAAAKGMKKVAAGTTAEISSNGITVADDGFTLGVDTDILVTSEQLSWIAIG